MKRSAKLRRRAVCLFLAAVLVICLLPTDCIPQAQAQVQALPGSLTVTNVVVFARLAGDDVDDFNTVDAYGNKNWDTICKMYDVGTGDATADNSFSAYFETISGGRLRVKNLFPQVKDGKANVFELKQDHYDSDDALIREILLTMDAATKEGSLYWENGVKLDNRQTGVLDNLTVILQGTTFNGKDRSFQGNYSGNETVRGVEVAYYNALPSVNFIDTYNPDGTVEHYGGFRAQGVAAHEFLHTLDLPDLYRSSGNGMPVGLWDVMASPGRIPQYPLEYQLWQLGWLDHASEVQEITQSGDYTLTAAGGGKGGVKLVTIKTPLSESASETLCLEFRKKPEGKGFYFESYLPLPESATNGGVIMYRVDDKVEGETNFNGQNYIYVYRPDVNDPEKAEDMTDSGLSNRVNDAALTRSDAVYGSTDLSAGYTQNTLYYSNGHNSGVQISNLRFSGDTVTFHVEFADYGDSWQPAGGAVATDAIVPRLYADEAANALYCAYLDKQYDVRVKQWDAASDTWQQLGGVVARAKSSELSLVSCGGTLYAAFIDENGCPAVSSWNGSTWATRRISSETGANSLQLVTDGSAVYAAYQNGVYPSRKIVIYDLNGTRIAESSVTASDFCNPTVVKDGTKFYIAYTKFGEGSKAQIDCYDTVGKSWSSVHTYTSVTGAVNLLQCKNGVLYGLACPQTGSGKAPVLAVYKDGVWTETPVPEAVDYDDINLTVAGQTPYLAFYDSNTGAPRLLRLSGGQWESCYDGLNGQTSYFQAVNISTQVYVAFMALNSNTVQVYQQQVTLAPDDPTDPNQPVTPVDPSAPTALNLTPPSGYTDSTVYVDGVAYSARESGGRLTVQLPDASGRIATMYLCTESGVPKGMYVWRLSYSNGVCTATALPGLQDLISYHGFSIRVQGKSGIRFKSGIDTGMRARLLSGGVDGYKLKEYGTMSMMAYNLEQYQFVLGGQKISSGRSYWKENGTVNDRVLETVSGRYRFASVLIDIPKNLYASDIAFRAYVILQDASGNEVTVYGPCVKRSIYTVAQQVMAAGEFKPGSTGYQYVQGIIRAVEQ